jgi:methyltransferase FkbM-like protein
MPVVKIDVKGAELDVLKGMRRTLADQRPFVTCEVLHADNEDVRPLCSERNRRILALLDDAGFMAHRLRKDADMKAVVGLEPVEAFPESTYRWDSPAVCDYLFVPKERVREALNAFGVFQEADPGGQARQRRR